MSLDEYVLAFVMAGGRGTRLMNLTRYRTKPAVGILGYYRIWDFVATNVANTGIPAMMVAIQFEPKSLTRHIGNGEIWGFDGADKNLDIVHPYEGGKKIIEFKGTADSVRKSMHRINRYNPRIVLVLGGDHVYTMTYNDVIKQHKNKNADATIMVNAIPENKASDFGIVRIDDEGRIIDFEEKPNPETSEGREIIEKFRLTKRQTERMNIKDPNLTHLGSMGNYVFFRDKLEDILNVYKGDDFGKNIIPLMKSDGKEIYAYVFEGYWKDVGKISDYFDCNIEFAENIALLDLIGNRVRTALRHLPPARVSNGGNIKNSIISPGDEIYGRVNKSVLGYQVIVEEGAEIKEGVLLGADRNEFYNNQLKRVFNTKIGRNSYLERVILDKNVQIGENVRISPEAPVKERIAKLKAIGLEACTGEDCPENTDVYIDPKRGIFVLGKQQDTTKLIIPDNFEC